jgi:hypothetical protein
MVRYLLCFSAFLIFFGRAYQFFFFGAPYRAIFWDESLLSPVVEGLFNCSWQEYATNSKVNTFIENLTILSSVVFLVSALLCLFWHQIKLHILKKTILGTGIFLLFFMGICMVKSKNYDILQLFELSIQLIVPLVIFFNASLKNMDVSKLSKWLKIAVALTFIPHGLFAMGLFYVPGHFIDMTIKILGVNENQATQLLFIVGVLDIIVSIFIFIPKLARPTLVYIMIWGFLTAVARLVSGFNPDFFWSSLHNSTYLTLYRLPHALVPLIIYLILPKTHTLTFKLRTNEN